MRAAVTTRYGGPEVVEVREVPTPTPADNEVLVRVARVERVLWRPDAPERAHSPFGY